MEVFILLPDGPQESDIQNALGTTRGPSVFWELGVADAVRARVNDPIGKTPEEPESYSMYRAELVVKEKIR